MTKPTIETVAELYRSADYQMREAARAVQRVAQAAANHGISETQIREHLAKKKNVELA